MTAHDERDNSVNPGTASPSALPLAQPRILYLGRSMATAETLRALLRDGSLAPGSQNGRLPQPAGDAHARNAVIGNDARGADAGPLLEIVASQKLALRHIFAQPPALVLVETSSKQDSRLRFCQALRLRMPGVAIVAVAGGRAQNYDFPFDAQVRTPVEPEQALAALRAVQANATESLLRRGPITLDIAARRVTSPKGTRTMTPKQCALLEMLMRSEQVVRRADIMQAIWETSYLEDTRTLDVHIHWLREMIEPEPASPIYLLTQRGVGYKFTAPADPLLHR